MTELQEGQALERVIRVYGIEAPVIVRITTAGVDLRVKGTKRHITASWTAVVNACSTAADVPSFLFGKPHDLLTHEVAMATKRAAERV